MVIECRKRPRQLVVESPVVTTPNPHNLFCPTLLCLPASPAEVPSLQLGSSLWASCSACFPVTGPLTNTCLARALTLPLLSSGLTHTAPNIPVLSQMEFLSSANYSTNVLIFPQPGPPVGNVNQHWPSSSLLMGVISESFLGYHLGQSPRLKLVQKNESCLLYIGRIICFMSATTSPLAARRMFMLSQPAALSHTCHVNLQVGTQCILCSSNFTFCSQGLGTKQWTNGDGTELAQQGDTKQISLESDQKRL